MKNRWELIGWDLREKASMPGLISGIYRQNISGDKCFKAEYSRYGKDKGQEFILVLPEKENEKRTMIMFIYGGAWSMGNPHLYRFCGYYFASLGFPAIVAGYRLLPKHKFPTQLDDVMASLINGIEIARLRGVCPDKLVLIGHSAGAHLAGTLAYGGYLDKYPALKDILRGIICIGGPMDFSACKYRFVSRKIKEFTADFPESSVADPIRLLKDNVSDGGEGEVIPALLIHGKNDSIVEVENSVNFVNTLNNIAPGKGDVLVIKKGLHSSLGKLLWGGMAETDNMLQWIKKIESEI